MAFADPEREREYKRLWCEKAKATGYYRQRKTGWTKEEYDAAYAAQGGCCALCGRHASEVERGLRADHCHATKTKRALLCGNCNTALGLLSDDPSLMRRAAAYVETHATGGEQSEIEEIK